MDKQKVYLSRLRNGQQGLFTAGRLVFSLDEVTKEEAVRIAERHGFEYDESQENLADRAEVVKR